MFRTNYRTVIRCRTFNISQKRLVIRLLKSPVCESDDRLALYAGVVRESQAASIACAYTRAPLLNEVSRIQIDSE